MALIMITMPAYAMKKPIKRITATTDIVEIDRVEGNGNASKDSYKAFLNIYGTFNGCTIHYLISTDEGTTKTAMKDLTRVAVTSTEADNFSYSFGWPGGGNTGEILYASVADDCTSAPSITIDISDNR